MYMERKDEEVEEIVNSIFDNEGYMRGEDDRKR